MNVRVTDHVVLQYLNRVRGLDVEQVRQLIADTCKSAVAAGAAGVTSDGFHYVLRGDAVITVLPRGGKPHTHMDKALIPRTERRRPISQLLTEDMD